MHAGLRGGAFVLALAGAGLAGARNPEPDEQLARVRLIVTTRAANAAITVGGAIIASYISSVLDGAPAVTPSRTGRTLQLSRNVPGQTAEARLAHNSLYTTRATPHPTLSGSRLARLLNQKRPSRDVF